MGESNLDKIDRQIADDATSQGRGEQKLVGVLGEAYALLSKGLSVGQIANELRIEERKLRWLLKLGEHK